MLVNSSVLRISAVPISAALSIKAIETRYRGRRFRSRLEAKFAVFLDSLGWSWSYEDEGFDLPKTGYYLPDFLVLSNDAGLPSPFWVEVKGSNPSIEEVNKLRELACRSGRHSYFFVGTQHKASYTPNAPYFPRPVVTLQNLAETRDLLGYEFPASCLFQHHQPPLKEFIPFEKQREAMLKRLPSEREEFDRQIEDLWMAGWGGELAIERVRRAAMAALSARFEFGEQG